MKAMIQKRVTRELVTPTVTTAARFLRANFFMRYSTPGTGSDVATWRFTVTPGRYRVATTWVPHDTARATNAPFTIYDGSNELAAVRINERLAPDDFSDAGVDWEYLSGALDIVGSQLIVRLSDDADSHVFADAVRIERIGDLPG